MRAVVCAEDGTIVKVLSGNPAMFALQAGEGELVFAIADDDDGRIIDDSVVTVSDPAQLVGHEDLILELIA